MIAQNKSWRRPELVVLVRSRPEEAVLAGCKTGGMAGPVGGKGECRNKIRGKCTGVQCSTLTGS